MTAVKNSEWGELNEEYWGSVFVGKTDYHGDIISANMEKMQIGEAKKKIN